MQINIVGGLNNLLTSSLIRPSYTIRATIFEKLFRPEKFPKTDKARWGELFFAASYCSLHEVNALIASLLHREGKQAFTPRQEQ